MLTCARPPAIDHPSTRLGCTPPQAVAAARHALPLRQSPRRTRTIRAFAQLTCTSPSHVLTGAAHAGLRLVTPGRCQLTHCHRCCPIARRRRSCDRALVLAGLHDAADRVLQGLLAFSRPFLCEPLQASGWRAHDVLRGPIDGGRLAVHAQPRRHDSRAFCRAALQLQPRGKLGAALSELQELAHGLSGCSECQPRPCTQQPPVVRRAATLLHHAESAAGGERLPPCTGHSTPSHGASSPPLLATRLLPSAAGHDRARAIAVRDTSTAAPARPSAGRACTPLFGCDCTVKSCACNSQEFLTGHYNLSTGIAF